MKKKYILSIVLLCVMIIMPVLSYGDADLGDLDGYKGNPVDSSELTSRANGILGLIQNIGAVISVVMLMIIGMKYMLGSVEERAEYKETLKPYLIGAFLLFTGTAIPQLIYKFMQNF